MDSREIVCRTVEFREPERVAASFPAPHWSDLRSVQYEHTGPHGDWHEVCAARQERIDEWGNTWARVDGSSKGEVARGAMEHWGDAEALELPDLADPANYEEVRRSCEDPSDDRYRLGGMPGFPFNIARKMRRLDQFLMDLLLSPDLVARLLLRIEDLLAGVMERYAEVGVDAVMFPEDWGTQRGLMIRPETWRAVFKPGYERLCGLAHDQAIKVFMHSCGKITDIIPDLIEAGVDVLQFDQPRLHGLDVLASFHGQITFWCPVDIQKTLQTRDEAAIAAEARELIEKLGGTDGGFIAGYYRDNVSIGLDPYWQEVACQAFAQYGDYARLG